ncbi:MAG: ATP-binding cassette domain-containing protein [Actinomycetota bacterium]
MNLSLLKRTKREPIRTEVVGPRSGPLDASETADAALTAALVVALLAAGRVLAAGSMFQVIASFVVAVLAARRRTRAVAISAAAAACIALILGGLGPVTQAALAGVFGWCGGQALRRGWGLFRSIGLTLLVGWPAMVISVLFVFPAVAINRKLRILVLENVENQADGGANILGGIGSLFAALGDVFGAIGLGFLETALDWVDDAFGWVGGLLPDIAGFLIDNWLLLIPAVELVYAIVYAVLIRAVGGAILRRLERSLMEPVAIDLQPAPDADPLPVSMANVVLERHGTPVSEPLTLRVDEGEHLVIEGPNGAGKSTLLDALAGLDNLGRLDRASDRVGLGHVGGTARVGQRPEAQVVGTTVEEDLRWGLDEDFDVRATLAAIGLDLPPDRPTSELSGGELQRLALASALRRRPRLLLADEVTSMLDPLEQARIIDRLAELDDATIVRTTHRNDAVAADRRITLRRRSSSTDTGTADPTGARVEPAPEEPAPEEPAEPELRTIRTSVTEGRLLRLRDVGFAHAHGKPWEHEVLAGINLSIHRYELVVIEGRNGSGKTTLARIVAGLDTATAGDVERTTGVKRALAHQHVRLQLLRATVREELYSLAGVRSDVVIDGSTAPHDQLAEPQPEPQPEAQPGAQAVDGASAPVSGPVADDSAHANRAANLAISVELFELRRLLDRRIDELSGGEQRRVLLAGLVARGVSLLVLDEPLAGLDAEGRADLARTLDQVRLAGTSVVVVSHDVDWAPRHVSRHLRLDDGKLHEVPLPAPGHDSFSGSQDFPRGSAERPGT